MASSFCKYPRRLLSKLILPASFSTVAEAPLPKQFPFPSFRAAKSAIASESNPENLAQIFESSAHFPTFCRHRPLYHLTVRKLAGAKRFDLIDRILETQKNSPTTNSEGFWIRLMILYSSAGMVEQATRTFDHVVQGKPCKLSEKSLCAILTVHLKNGLPEKVHDLFKTLPSSMSVDPGVVSHNLVLKAFTLENNIELARNWIEKMCKEDSKVAPNIDSYNIILGAYMKKGDMSGFDEIMGEIEKKGLEFNLATYNYKISRLCEKMECARAKKLLNEMIAKGVNPNSASYNTIIDRFSKLGDFDSAMKVLKNLQEDGYVSPCSNTYNTLVWSMVKEGEYDLALDMCKEIIQRRWIPPFQVMKDLVSGLVKASRVEEAKEVIEKMKKRLKGPSADSWGKIEAALAL